MAFTNRFEADISPKKTRIDAKAYQQYIDIPIGQNPETGKVYTFRAYIAVSKMQKKLNYKPTILVTLTFFKYKLHLQTRDIDALNSAFRKLSSFIDLQESNLKDKLSQEISAYDKWEQEYIDRKKEGIISINRWLYHFSLVTSPIYIVIRRPMAAFIYRYK